MKVLVYEFVSAGGLGPASSPSLRREGLAMLRCAAEDFNQVDGIEVMTLLDPSLGNVPLPGYIVRTGPGCKLSAFEAALDEADAAFVIAPEFGGILEGYAHKVQERGVLLLSSPPGAVRLATNKLELGRALTRQGIPAAEGVLFDPTTGLPDGASFPCVMKPVDGAGSLNTFLLRAPEEYLSADLQEPPAEYKGQALLQPFYPGVSASVSFLIHQGQFHPLLPGTQNLSSEGQFRYLGGALPLDGDLASRAITLAARAISAIGGLRGFVGVDLILGPENKDFVMEINPRLTTSYVGLRALSRTNLMASLYRLVMKGEMPAISWNNSRVSFLPDGTVILHE